METDDKQPSTFKTEVLKERGKKRLPSTRASRRAKTMALVKQVTSLLEQLGPHKNEAVQVLVDQMKAMKAIRNASGEVSNWVPDEIIRQKAAIAILEWLEGKPRELQIQVHGTPEDFDKVLEIARQTQSHDDRRP